MEKVKIQLDLRNSANCRFPDFKLDFLLVFLDIGSIGQDACLIFSQTA